MIFKRYIWCFVVVFLFWVITPAYAMNVTLQWDPNTEPNLAGYKIYYDTDSGAPYNPAVGDRATNNPDGPPIVLGSDTTEITLAGLSDGKVYFFSITAFDDQGQESDYSNEVTTDNSPPGKVTNLSSSPDRQTWSNDNTVTVSWTAADDGSLGSGVDGYSILWNTNPTTVPDTSKDIGAVTTTTSAPLADGNSHWFHIRAVDVAGYWGEAEHWGPFYIQTGAPSILNYPTIDYGNNTIEITYSKTTMQNAMVQGNYRFNPSLNIVSITNPSGSTYRLTMASVPEHIIFTLTVNNITDVAGNAVTPSSVRINDNDNDQMADDWESRHGVTNPGGDPDSDGLSNLQEFNGGGTLSTDPNNPDTDGDQLPDGWEVGNGLDPLDATGANGKGGDLDSDGWTNYEEYVGGSDPADPAEHPPALQPPDMQIKEVAPHHNAGISDQTRVPSNTSFYLRIEDADGIDITDSGSIRFTIDDGVNPVYQRDLSNTTVVRVTKLTGEDSTRVTALWVVYHRSAEVGLGDYPFDANINIKLDAMDSTGSRMAQQSYDFKTETQTAHDLAALNSPDTDPVDPADPALGDPEHSYDAGIEVSSGDLKGAKVVYDTSEPVQPAFGPTNEIPSANVAGVTGVGIPVNLQPPTLFTTPVKIFIPCPGYPDVSNLSVYFYTGTAWVVACDPDGTVLPGGEGWMVPGSRVNHNNGNPSTIEIKVYHFSAAQAGVLTDGSSSALVGCFISTSAYGSLLESPLKDVGKSLHITLILLFMGAFVAPWFVIVRKLIKEANGAMKSDTLRLFGRGLKGRRDCP